VPRTGPAQYRPPRRQAPIDVSLRPVGSRTPWNRPVLSDEIISEIAQARIRSALSRVTPSTGAAPVLTTPSVLSIDYFDDSATHNPHICHAHEERDWGSTR